MLPADPMDSADPPRTVLTLLSAFDLQHDGITLVVPVPAQRLLAFLALQGRPTQRRTVARTLWADCDETQAAARLRSTLWRLPAPDGERLVHIENGRLSLAAELDVDVRMAEDESRLAHLDVQTLCGDVLSGWTEQWVVIERERFRQLRMRRLEQLSERFRRDGHFALALQGALASVAVEPLRESAHRQVMLVHLAEANPSEALRQFDIVRCLLRDELGIAPSPATRAVVAHLLGRPLDAQAAG